MHPTRPQQSIINELTGHASLLLSNTTPTIINSSPLQTSTNNTSAQTNSNANTNPPLVVNFSDDDLIPEDSINFKKPQNEIFKKLDGKIQKIVAAHSNLNKLYALNDFSSTGPRKPFELPPQLPRPPPWVPKVSSDYGCSQWAEETLNNLNRIHPMDMEPNFKPRLSVPSQDRATRIGGPSRYEIPSPSKQPPPTLDSAISRLHQRRQLQQNPQLQKVLLRPLNKSQSIQQKLQVPQPQPRISQQAQKIHQLNIRPQQGSTPNAVRELFPGPSRSNNNLAQFSSKDIGALNALIKAQKQQQLQQVSTPKESTGPTSIKTNLTPEERRKFQMELINIFRQEIAAVTKLAKLKFQSPQQNDRHKIADQNSILLKKSPQSLFNTIRRETSLLLNRREPNRSGTSLLCEQQSSGRSIYGQPHVLRPTFNRFQSIKVVVSPSEHFKHACGKHPSGKEGSENSNCNCFKSKAQNLGVDEWCPSQQFTLEYRKLQKKLYQLKYVHKKDELEMNRGISISMLPADARKRASNPQKSLDNIVGRLQAKCMSSTSSSPVNQESQDQSSRVSSPAQDTSRVTQKIETFSPPQSPKPIPVFRSLTNKSGFISGTTMNPNQRVVSLKSKKAKRLYHFGLRLGNYMEKDSAQQTNEKITVEQFAKCLNLVRTNDASLKRHQEKLKQSESRWRVPIGDRPLRLRRVRGERVHMPVSASYKASRRVGLQ